MDVAVVVFLSALLAFLFFPLAPPPPSSISSSDDADGGGDGIDIWDSDVPSLLTSLVSASHSALKVDEKKSCSNGRD